MIYIVINLKPGSSIHSLTRHARIHTCTHAWPERPYPSDGGVRHVRSRRRLLDTDGELTFVQTKNVGFHGIELGSVYLIERFLGTTLHVINVMNGTALILYSMHCSSAYVSSHSFMSIHGRSCGCQSACTNDSSGIWSEDVALVKTMKFYLTRTIIDVMPFYCMKI